MAAVYRPRRELQKVAPRNFDAFFEPVYFEEAKIDSRNSCGAVPPKGGPLLQFAASAGRFPLLHVAIKRLKQRKEIPMTDTTGKIAELNDLCRKAMGVAGRVFKTSGISSLPEEDQSEIMEKAETFNAFTPDNDPYGERDFGAFEHNGQRIFWKIDYYDTTMTKGSEDPSDPKQTVRVLTIMLASEY